MGVLSVCMSVCLPVTIMWTFTKHNGANSVLKCKRSPALCCTGWNYYLVSSQNFECYKMPFSHELILMISYVTKTCPLKRSARDLWLAGFFELVTFKSIYFSIRLCGLLMLPVHAAFKRMIPVVFEKDDDDNGHIDFIAAASVCS